MGDAEGEDTVMDAGEVAAVGWLRSVAGAPGDPYQTQMWFRYVGVVTKNAAAVTVFRNALPYSYSVGSTRFDYWLGRIKTVVREEGGRTVLRLHYRACDGMYTYDDFASQRSLTLTFDEVVTLLGRAVAVLVDRPWSLEPGFGAPEDVSGNPAMRAVEEFRRDFGCRLAPRREDAPSGWKVECLISAITCSTHVDGKFCAVVLESTTSRRPRITEARFGDDTVAFQPEMTLDYLIHGKRGDARFVISVRSGREYSYRTTREYPFPEDDWDGEPE